jgi:uncharacterized protein (DUF433 family)
MTTAAVVNIGMMIDSEPWIHGARPIIAGTGVTVRRIAIWHKHGYSPEEIIRKIEHLSLAQIHAALAYYHANREAIEADIVTEDKTYERLMREHYANQPPNQYRER